jgi:hypothetical protein
MRLSKAQAIGRQKARIARCEEVLQDENMVLAQIEDGQFEGCDLADVPDPWR